MRALVQRVLRAAVSVDGETVGFVGRGLLVLAAVAAEDGPEDADAMAGKTLRLRIFQDDEGRMNRSVADVGGGILAVSQFTLYGDVRKGNRPGFERSAPPERARALFDRLVEGLRASGLRVETGRFAAHMEVELVNDGPVTLQVDVPPGPA